MDSINQCGERECCLVQSVNVPVPDWHEPYGDRRQEIVFIGIDLDEKTITDGLNQSVRREGVLPRAILVLEVQIQLN